MGKAVNWPSLKLTFSCNLVVHEYDLGYTFCSILWWLTCGKLIKHFWDFKICLLCCWLSKVSKPNEWKKLEVELVSTYFRTKKNHSWFAHANYFWYKGLWNWPLSSVCISLSMTSALVTMLDHTGHFFRTNSLNF